MPRLSNRLHSVYILQSVLDGKGSLTNLLSDRALNRDQLNPALVREYCFGVCRWYHRLRFIAGRCLHKPLKPKDRDVLCLILLGLYQLLYMRTPDHAAIHETVAETAGLKKPWAKSLVNAVLREAQRRQDVLAEQISTSPEAEFAHPLWLVEAIRESWPDHWQQILAANNDRAPMCLRINTARTTREAYLARLASAGVPARAGTVAETAVILDEPRVVQDIPGFNEGLVSVQDESSQLAAAFLSPGPGHRVLDACAAPGGKACAILERQPALEDLLAIDSDEHRVSAIHENLERLALSARVLCADAGEPGHWHDGRGFDRILLDAPCSATGVIRRHPDIKLLRRTGDIPSLGQRQQHLLAALWPCLNTGGLLLYSTCSILRDENDGQIGSFLDRHPDARTEALQCPEAISCAHGIQLLPGLGNTDGFYYSLLQKC